MNQLAISAIVCGLAAIAYQGEPSTRRFFVVLAFVVLLAMSLMPYLT